MAKMENRVIRTDDALWQAVGEEAKRLGLGVPDFVRRALSVAVSPPLCFQCSERARWTISAELTSPYSPELDTDTLLRQIAHGLAVEVRSPIRVLAFACEGHKEEGMDWAWERYGAASAERLN